MKKVLLFALAAWTIISCERNSKNVVVVYDTINNDTTLLKIDSITPYKNFAGLLPCKNCDGINSFLTLLQDSSFNYSETRIGTEAQDSLIERSGNYKVSINEERSIMSLNFKDGTFKYFQLYGDSAIKLLNSEKKELTTDQNTFLKKN
jgi:hypothetical protein